MSLTLQAQEDTDGSNVLKISLTDFIIGQYTLGYERVMGPDWSMNASISGVGYEVAAQNYSLGYFYNEIALVRKKTKTN